MLYTLLRKRLGGEVKRFHTTPMLREHLVSSHSWGVALCVLAMQPECRKELLVAALEHDIHEHVTCDVNAVTKWKFPEISAALKDIERRINGELGIPMGNLTPYEQQVLKTADLGDLVLCCLAEYQMGNQGALKICERGLSFLGDFCDGKATRRFYNELENHVIATVGLEAYRAAEQS